MKERSIIFSDWEVRAVLEKRKSLILRPLVRSTEFKGPYNQAYLEAHRSSDGWAKICPFGSIGDRVWVRETWKPVHSGDPSRGARYCIDCEPDQTIWRYPSHMPRWASRITLEITGVSVQRVQEISDAECEAVGVRPSVDGHGGRDWRDDETGWRRTFRHVWDSHYTKINLSFDANPWVWMIEFKQVEREG